ncbi:hypothetical protein [Plantibacter flavus]|nr:hypothetical protein [Plantibacter flavus]
MPAEVAEILDDAFPGWLENSNLKKEHKLVILHPLQFDDAVKQLAKKLEQDGSYPIWITSLGQWLREQRTRDTAGELPEDERATLDSVAPDWRAPGVRKSAAAAKEWRERTEEISAFINEFGHLPRASRRASTEERKLNAWLSRTIQGEIDVIASGDLDRFAPGWRDYKIVVDSGIDLEFADFTTELATFVTAFGRLPEPDGEALPDDGEAELHRELNSYRLRRRDLALDAIQIEQLDAIDPGWAVPAQQLPETDASFRRRLERVRELYKRNYSWPKTPHSDYLVADAAQFILDQQLNFRAGTLGKTRLGLLDSVLPGWLTASVVYGVRSVAGQDYVDVAIEAVQTAFPKLASTDPLGFARRVAILTKEGVIESEEDDTVVDSSKTKKKDSDEGDDPKE